MRVILAEETEPSTPPEFAVIKVAPEFNVNAGTPVLPTKEETLNAPKSNVPFTVILVIPFEELPSFKAIFELRTTLLPELIK